MSKMGNFLVGVAEATANHIMDGILDDAIVYIGEEVDRAYSAGYLEKLRKQLGVEHLDDLLVQYGYGRETNDGSKFFEENMDEMLELAEKLNVHPWARAEVMDVIKGIKPKAHIREIYDEVSIALLEAF